MFPAIKRTVREQKVDCVFLDSISRAGFGDLTENKPVNAIADALNSLGVEWFGIAHTPRGDESHVYGSVFFEAAADVMLSVGSQQKENGTLGLSLQITKQNDMGPQPSQILGLDFEPWGLSAARRSSLKEFPELAKKPRGTKEEIADYLNEMGEATASQVAYALDMNRSHVSLVLNGDVLFEKTRKDGREQYFGVRVTP